MVCVVKWYILHMLALLRFDLRLLKFAHTYDTRSQSMQWHSCAYVLTEGPVSYLERVVDDVHNRVGVPFKDIYDCHLPAGSKPNP